jgi:FkbM family methyltransferase
MLALFFRKIVLLICQIANQFAIGRRALNQIIENSLGITMKIVHQGLALTFSAPNELCRYRVTSFSVKEPQTLRWIDAIPSQSIVWDIGANIGLYSIYAAKKCDALVYAFEPSIFNLEQLARNIYLNNLQDNVVIVPIAINDKGGPNYFNMSSTSWGGALSTFGHDFGQDGNALKTCFRYQTCSIRLDDITSHFGVPAPQYLKIDVDGIEHLILAGGRQVLQQVDQVLIEINDDFLLQSQVSEAILRESGLTLASKADLGNGDQFNQLWIRE